MSDPLLKPSEVKELQKAVAHCGRCLGRTEMLRTMGFDPGEDEERAKAAQDKYQAALQLHAMNEAANGRVYGG